MCSYRLRHKGCRLQTTLMSVLIFLSFTGLLVSRIEAGPQEEVSIAVAIITDDNNGAIKLLRPLAEAGDIDAQYLLGRLLLGEKDKSKSSTWLQRAANKGHASAQARLAGLMFGEKNYVKAGQWLRRAAAQGQPYGQLLLGGAYTLGLGVPQNYSEAHKWLNLAASQFPPDSKERNSAEEQRDQVETHMSPTEIAAARDAARDWSPKPELPTDRPKPLYAVDW